jgi:DNA repair exonuclease SbcCD ATPase subunit
MTFELKEREDERDNLAMTLYRHESDSQRLLYVKNTLSEDLAKKEQQIANMKKELRDMSKVTVIQNGAQQIQRQFSSRLSGFTRRPPKNSSTSPSMSSYYTEKLNKIERHIKLREEECANLGLELEKLEADSQIFTDLAKDLMARLNAKNQEIKKLLKSKTKEQLQSSGILGERDQLKSELERLKGDSDTFSALVKALTDERKTKLEHVEKYKKRHREMATSIGITSPYKASDVGGDDDDDNSVGSTWSLMSIDTVSTCASNVNSSLTMTKIDYDQKMSQLESNITKFEDERVFILTDLEKLEADTHAFMELSGALKQKLKAKEDQVEKAKKDLDDFTNKLQKQEMELQGLANKGKKATK